MRIAICDDEEILLEIVKDKCITLLKDSNLEYDINGNLYWCTFTIVIKSVKH